MRRRYSGQEAEAAMAFLRETRPDIYRGIIFNEIVRGNQTEAPVADLYAIMRRGDFVRDVRESTSDVSVLLLAIRKLIHAKWDSFREELDGFEKFCQS